VPDFGRAEAHTIKDRDQEEDRKGREHHATGGRRSVAGDPNANHAKC
jgi:hypothetical protein